MLAALLKSIQSIMSVDVGNPRLLDAQFRALSRQLPMMYGVLLINTWALASTHIDSAPSVLTIFVPVVLTVVCGIRVRWWRKERLRSPSSAEIVQALRRTNKLAVMIAAGFAGWSLALYPYGDAYAQAHVAFFMGITVIVCIFCLMHLRPAALWATVVVDAAFIVFFASTGNPTFIATALNIALVSIAMLIVLNSHYRSFTRLIDMQAHAERLSSQNLLLANQDALTDLPNRRAFFSTLENAIVGACARQEQLAVGVIDLDGFKLVNDLYGHGAGDHLLTCVGSRLKPFVGSNVLLARLGGDEFAFILTSRQAGADAERFAETILDSLRNTFMVLDTPMLVGATVGIATFPDNATNAEQLYEYADYALYQGKRDNPGSTCMFCENHRRQLEHRAAVEHALRRADLDRELYLVYQPILDCHTGATVAFEALARWRSPELGELSPAVFIPTAERIGMIRQLTLPLLKKALEAARTWPEPTRLSFNLSAHDVGSMEQVRRITNMVISHEFDPSRVDFEITETAIMYDISQVQRAVQDFRNLGCGVSLDDFGTGYSSLSQLHALALTKLKVDRSFVTDIDQSASSSKIVKSLVTLAQDMALESIVEGVETRAELDALLRLGCRYVQGYLFSRPLLVEQTLPWLEASAAHQPDSNHGRTEYQQA